MSLAHPILKGWLELTTLLAVDRCMELMAEDPERQRRRITLLGERAKLSKAQEWMDSIRRNDDYEDTEMSEITVGDSFSPLTEWIDESI